MTMFVRNAASLIGPYFAPKWSNAPRLLALTSSIALRALHLKYTNIFTGNVDAAIDALTSDKPKIVEFPELFHKAIFYGLLPDLSIQCGAGWLHSKLIVLTRNSLLPDQINKWLTVIQQAAPLVPLPYPEEILTHNCSTMIDETIDMIGKMGRVFNILLTITKIYRLSTTLYHPSLPFPLNRSRGVFSIILGFITVMVLCHVMIQRFLAQSVERANKSKEDAIQALVSTDADQPRIAALPEANKTRLVGLLSARITTALESASSTQNGFTMQEISSFALPSCFELFISRLGYQIAKAAPELELKTIFPPLLRTSIGLVWNTSYFVQNIMNSYTSFQLAMKKMGDLQAFLNQERSNIPMENGNSLTFTNVSLSVESEGKQLKLLENFSTKLELGALYYFQGKNGCGKSTACRLVQNLQKAQAGSLIRPNVILFLPSKLPIIDTSPKSFENMLDSVFGVNDTGSINNIKQELRKFDSYRSMDVLDSGERNWNTLSDGERQILNWIVTLEIASKTPNIPCLLIGDEAVSGMDHKQRPQMLKHVKEWMHGDPTNRGVVLIDHDEKFPEEEVPLSHTGTAGFKIFKRS